VSACRRSVGQIRTDKSFLDGSPHALQEGEIIVAEEKNS
jgi:hypothetical protein